ncbi:hypothetical protein KDX09_35670 [Burkholderia cenocepacia]|uniref:hypothetical protein n=1 Tax=Burkholderia cenocepacia TaxID=95486 RepID=UPI001B9A8790|nr:hypothetical protein [Burkholderia cenocepacia]MBR8094704.1 hypothetical protein [Burkholderia cenocepacia]
MPLIDVVGSYLQSVDLVIGILSRERRSDWTLFELGVAWSNSRQILLVVPPGASLVPPWNMPGLLVVRANPSGVEAIGFALDQLMSAPPREISSQTPSKSASLGASANELLQAASAAVRNSDGKALEDVIGKALEGADLDGIAREASSKDARPDFAVWVDALASTVGNPLLIEVKLQLSDRPSMRMAAARLSEAVLATGTRFGLLVYGEGPPSDQVDRTLPFNVLALSATKLLESLRTNSFAAVISQLRNRRVHGVDH